LIISNVCVSIHDLIPEVIIIPELHHFFNHIEKFFFSPVYKLVVTLVILENFKDHSIKIIILIGIFPLLDSIVTIFIHFNQNLYLTCFSWSIIWLKCKISTVLISTRSYLIFQAFDYSLILINHFLGLNHDT
jgi:hypothetical protein